MNISLLISLIIGLTILAIGMIALKKEPSLLQKRFKKTATQKQSTLNHILYNLHEIIKPLSINNIKASDSKKNPKKLLLQAGEPSSNEDIINYESTKILYAIGAIFFGLILFYFLEFSINTTLMLTIIITILAYRYPEMKLHKKIKSRQKEFMKFLPDAVDLLSICVQAGLGLDSAFAKVAEEFSLTSKLLSTEFERLNKDILSGLNRQESYKNLAQRNENQDLQSFVALLIQSDKLGTSVTQSLDVFCDTLRTRKRQRIEEIAQKASTKMTIPMVLFMLPAIFIIIMFPAIQKIMQNLG